MEGVDAIEAVGVSCPGPMGIGAGRGTSSLTSLMTDSESLAVDSRRNIRGRPTLGVRACLTVSLAFLPIA